MMDISFASVCSLYYQRFFIESTKYLKECNISSSCYSLYKCNPLYVLSFVFTNILNHFCHTHNVNKEHE